MFEILQILLYKLYKLTCHQLKEDDTVSYQHVQPIFSLPVLNPIHIHMYTSISSHFRNWIIPACAGKFRLYILTENTFRLGIQSSIKKKKKRLHGHQSFTTTNVGRPSTLGRSLSLNRRPSLFISQAIEKLFFVFVFVFVLRYSGWNTFVMWYEKEARVLEYYIMFAISLNGWLKFKEHQEENLEGLGSS